MAALSLAIYAGADDLTDDLVDGIWGVCEEHFWGVSAHVWRGRFPTSTLPDTAEPAIDLFVAATAALPARIDRLVGHVLAGVLAIVRNRVRREVQRRVPEPDVERDDWWWLGLAPRRPDRAINNGKPWIHANFLTATVLLEPDVGRGNVAAADGAGRRHVSVVPGAGLDGGRTESRGELLQLHCSAASSG